MSLNLRTLLLSGIAAQLLIGPGQAHADCATSGSAATCSGDLSEGVSFQNENITELLIQDLTSDIEPASTSSAVVLENQGATNEEAIGSLVTFDGGGFGIVSQLDGIDAFSLGGDGSDALNGGPPADDQLVRAGSDGAGIVDDMEAGIVFESGFVSGSGSDNSLLSVLSQGGKGGNGGSGTSVVGNEHGGAGGSGSAAGSISFSAASGVSVTASGGGTAISLTGQGGDGGEGGEGVASTLGSGYGGDGASGGDGGMATVTIDGGSFTQDGSDTLFLLNSVAGDGGDAGEGRSDSAGSGYGGEGGIGGDGGTITFDLNAGSFTVGTAGGNAITIQSQGGQGGNGGEGRSDAGGDGNGGAAGAGGDSGFITVSTSATDPSQVRITTNSTSLTQSAVRIESLAGSGGVGGEGISSVGAGSGGNGGQGGTGDAVQIDLLATITTKGSGSQGLHVRSYGGAGGDGGSGSAGIGPGEGGADLGGGPGGDVNVNFAGSITTSGDEANGILAQSVGGFSGNAGSSTGFLAFGASGQSAGDAGSAEIFVNFDLLEGVSITTMGDWAAAVRAQSVGGGGGLGSTADGIGALGGSGSAGGDGDSAVIEFFSGTVETHGQGARGLEASSRGGSGGDAGGSTGVTALGGSGGTGGNGGGVSISTSAPVTTYNNQADAIYAASLGGGGGSAHSTVGIVSLGGSGGDGGDAGTVSVNLGVDISTSGDDADAIFLHSVGGSGGDGSNAIAVSEVGFSLAIGGSGGSGGDGNDATFDDESARGYKVTTHGDRSRGLVAHSVGGSGGDAGSAISVSLSPTLSFGLGASGDGGPGGSGGVASITTGGDISTAGSSAPAISAQSTGGGGGHAGTTVTSADSAGVAIGVSVGGSGGNGGDGGTVTVTAGGTLETKSSASPALLAHSQGGGGGHSGVTVTGDAMATANASISVGGSGGAGGNGGEVTVTAEGRIATEEEASPGIVAHSIGSGGGNAYSTISASGVTNATFGLGIGGSGGASGDGGPVTVTASGREIKTAGSNAPGITAMSIGAGGGDGGISVTGDIETSANIGLSIGGDGGAGGDAGAVQVNSTSRISTKSDLSPGIRVMSIAESGGNAGLAINGSAISGVNITNLSVGGSGGGGGTSGTATTINSGDVTTSGAYSHALSAQSIAGGGGNGAGAVNGSLLSAGSLNVTVGGAGGGGGTAGDVSVQSASSLETEGHNSHGILAQSQGGTGGSGGFAAEGGITGGTVSGSVTYTLGGEGGTGGTAGAVSVLTDGSITTSDYGSNGIMALSVGGDGGTGGSVYTGNVSAGGSESITMTVDIATGGDGGSGGIGGAVDIENQADISTSSYRATGVRGLSVGGNGGVGGNAYSVLVDQDSTVSMNFTYTTGGDGGTAATGGDVSIANSGRVVTERDGSSAVIAQSVGGSGGDGGSAGSVFVQLPSSATTSGSMDFGATISVGGTGGSGNDGGDVVLSNSGEIRTKGDSAKALIAHSVGGGGGLGGTSSSLLLSFDKACSLTDSLTSYICGAGSTSSNVTLEGDIAIGGKGGAGGDAGTVIVENEGGIETTGILSHAIVAHSLGGGGGTGGEGDLGIDAWTTNAVAEDIETVTSTLFSIGAFNSITVAVGGSEGAQGSGGDIDVFNAGPLQTSGDHAFGMHVQSVGGGGGSGGAGHSGFFSEVTVGGAGSGGGDGGDIAIENLGPIVTSGEGGVGILAHSVGGGGGAAGDIERALTSSFADLNIGVGVGVQNDAGAGGDGGSVSILSQGQITTSNTQSHGIVAQSLGGSGGIAGISGSASGASAYNFVGSAGDGGNGGTVDVTVLAPITVSGDQSHGIFAQSVTGSGSGDTSGAVTITAGADIRATGSEGRAIMAQSESADGTNNTIAITIAETARVSTAADGFETIALFDGANNTILNQGTLIQEGGSSASGFVIRTDGDAALTVTNEGLLQGSILTESSGSSAPQGITILNMEGGTFGLGSSVLLGGSAGSITNAGTLSAAGTGAIGISEVSGTITQDSGGILWVDFELGESGDLIVLDQSGSSSFAGSVMPNPLGGFLEDESSQTLDIVSSEGSLSSDGLSVPSTAIIDYSVSQTTTSQGVEVIQLTYAVDYTPWDGTEGAQAKVPSGLREIISFNHSNFGDSAGQTIGTTDPSSNNAEFVEEFGLFLAGIPTVEGLVDVYDRFAPGEIFAPLDAALFSSRRFADDMNSCSARNPEGGVVFTRQGSCLWLQADGGATDRQRTENSIDYDERYFGLSFGGQTALGDGLFAGLAFGWEDSSLSNARFSGDGNRFQGGIVLKQEVEATTLTGSFSGGVGTYDLSRNVLTPSGGRTAESSPNANWLSAHARISQIVPLSETAYFKPWFDVGVDHQWQGGYSETGAGAYGLQVAGFQQTLVTMNPMMEVGNTFQVFGAEANARASAGLLAVVSGRNRSTEVNVIGLGGPAYEVSDTARPLFADIGAHLDLVVHERAVVSFGGQALLAGNQQEYGGSGRLSIFF